MSVTWSAKDIDPNSAEANKIPQLEFVRPEQHQFPVMVYSCSKPQETCMAAKAWQLGLASELKAPNMLRMETQELHNIGGKQARLVAIADAAHDSYGNEVSLMPLMIAEDSRTRFFSSTFTYFSLLTELSRLGRITLRARMNPVLPAHQISSKKAHAACADPHCRLFVFLRDTFLKAAEIPHSQDFLNAEAMIDWSVDIVEPYTALERIERLITKDFSNVKATDLSNDRYLKHLEPAEVRLASIAHLKCAEYLFLKRVFFKDFYAAVMGSDKDIGQRQGNGRLVKVRTNRQHMQWLEKQQQIPSYNAKKLVLGWSVLGLLDEKRMLPWIRAGGQFAEEELEEED